MTFRRAWMMFALTGRLALASVGVATAAQAATMHLPTFGVAVDANGALSVKTFADPTGQLPAEHLRAGTLRPEKATAGSGADAKSTAEAMAGDIRGEKVLLMVSHSLRKEARKNPEGLPEDIVRALRNAKVKVVRVVDVESSARYAALPDYLEQLILLDCQGGDPKKALTDVPHRNAGIVFKDGNYKDGLGDPSIDKFAKQARLPPKAHALAVWGSVKPDQKRKEQDLARYGRLPELDVKYAPPQAGSFGGGGVATLTPKAGHTLLEVYLSARVAIGIE